MTHPTQIAQARLQSGITNLTAWIDVLPGVEQGAVISFKDSDRRWRILALGEPRDVKDVRNYGRRYREVQGGLE